MKSSQPLQTNKKDFDLQKPKPVNSTGYQLNIDGSKPIKAIGYGTDHRDHPLQLMDFDRRVPLDDDVVIKIIYCGVCHSDWHVILNEWKNTKYPCIVGHEITGIVIKAGAKTNFKVNDRVAVGPNYNSCRKCNQCKIGFEQYCLNDVTEVYNMPDRKDKEELKPTGPITYGGYSNVIVVNQNYVLRVADNAELDYVAPLLCAGSTMYTPLKYLQIGKGHRVGIAGIGGLGHLGVKLAKAMGAEVIALTKTPEKIQASLDLGADRAILVTDNDVLKPYEATFDLIIDTIPFNHDMMPYINLVKPNSTLWIVGSFFTMATDFDLVNRKGRIIRGSSTAGIADTQELLDLCAANNIYPNIEVINIQDINKTHEQLLLSRCRFRYVIDIDTINGKKLKNN